MQSDASTEIAAPRSDTPVSNGTVNPDTTLPDANATDNATSLDSSFPPTSVPSEELPVNAEATVPATQPTALSPVPAQKGKELHDKAENINRLHSLRRSERLRNQELRAEEARRIREERDLIEAEKAKSRRIAAKKAVATKRKAAIEAEKKIMDDIDVKVRKTSAGPLTGTASISPSPSGRSSNRPGAKYIVKLPYLNIKPAPELVPISMGETTANLFWLRMNLREFLFRFDKLCRLPSRFGSSINDPLQPYTQEQLKTVALTLLKLINNDAAPLHRKVADYIAEIDNLDAANPNIWDWLLRFIEELDAYAPHEVPTTEEEQLDLLRRLMVICTGTETIRITVVTDVDQLKYIEKETQDQIKAISNKCKDTEAKLAKLKSVDKEVWSEKVAAARRSADNKAWKSQQQLYTKVHKYNMRTAPIITDPAGNRYWSFQYKSAAQSDWGSWVICEIVKKPSELSHWFTELAKNVDHVLMGRDEMVTSKNIERKQKRVEAKLLESASTNSDVKAEAGLGNVPLGGSDSYVITGTAAVSPNDGAFLKYDELEGVVSTVNGEATPEHTPATAPEPSPDATTTSTSGTDIRTNSMVTTAPDYKPKRKYPKLKVKPLEPLPEAELYYVEGRENILELATWLAGYPGIDAKALAELDSLANYLASEV